MQVDLFESAHAQAMYRQRGKMYQRGFKLNPQFGKLNGMREYFNDASEFEYYRSNLFKQLDRFKPGKRYEFIGSAAMDTLYELETLGVGEYVHGYIMIADFSRSLDYVLHRQYGCKMQDIRGIEDYDLISSSILNCNFDKVDSQITFDRLLKASPELCNGISQLSEVASKNEELSVDNQVSWMIYTFYQEILSMLSNVKYYTMMMLCTNSEVYRHNKGAIRSSSYSSIIATIDCRFDDEVTLHQNNDKIDDYKIIVRSYAPYEYLGEVLRNNEFTWRF